MKLEIASDKVWLGFAARFPISALLVGDFHCSYSVVVLRMQDDISNLEIILRQYALDCHSHNVFDENLLI